MLIYRAEVILTKKKEYTIATILALILALSLAGISHFFPLATEKQTTQNQITKIDGKIPEVIGSVGPAIQLPNITITQDGSINPQNSPLKKDGKKYALTGNIINQTLMIQLSNIIIDGGGYEIQGPTNAGTGIFLQNVSNVTIMKNEIVLLKYGILAINCSNIVCIDNTISNVSKAISLDSCENCAISNNKVNSAGLAIENCATNSMNNTITQNIITNSIEGIMVEGAFTAITENYIVNVYRQIGVLSNNTKISKNYGANGIAGIMLIGANCNIHNNEGSNFSDSYIIINSGSNNKFYENTISNSERAIIFRTNDEKKIGNNLFYHNNFINNSISIQLEAQTGQNSWDANLEGNYWSNYNGTDTDGNGIGDIPYIINENNIDHFPLTSQYGIEENGNMVFVYLGIIGLVSFVLIVVTILILSSRKN